MPTLQFSGSFYTDGVYRFTEPGDYEVSDEKAKQLLADFPNEFAARQGGQNDEKPASATPSLSKMNRSQLEAVAGQIGLTVTKDLDTNQKLKDAIEAHQKEQ